MTDTGVSAAALVTLAGAVASITPNFLARAFRFSSSEVSAAVSVSAASVFAESAAAGFAAVAFVASGTAAAPSAFQTIGCLACNSCESTHWLNEACPGHGSSYFVVMFAYFA